MWVGNVVPEEVLQEARGRRGPEAAVAAVPPPVRDVADQHPAKVRRFSARLAERRMNQ